MTRRAIRFDDTPRTPVAVPRSFEGATIPAPLVLRGPEPIDVDRWKLLTPIRIPARPFLKSAIDGSTKAAVLALAEFGRAIAESKKQADGLTAVLPPRPRNDKIRR